jgi:hypothetical protein
VNLAAILTPDGGEPSGYQSAEREFTSLEPPFSLGSFEGFVYQNLDENISIRVSNWTLESSGLQAYHVVFDIFNSSSSRFAPYSLNLSGIDDENATALVTGIVFPWQTLVESYYAWLQTAMRTAEYGYYISVLGGLILP